MIKIKRRNGPAGQVSFIATTADGTVTFVGSVYGGPVVMVLPSGHQTFVSDPGRFGRFGADWVQRFLSD